MRHQWIFYSILSLLLLYTAYRGAALWPAHRFWAVVLTGLLFALMLTWQFWYRVHPEIIDSRLFHALSWSGSVAMGLWATFILLGLPIDVLKLFGAALPFDPGRRESFFRLMKGASTGILGLSGAMAGAGLFTVLRGPRVKEVSVPLKGAVGDLGLKIAQISDLHVGPTVLRSSVEEIVRRTNALGADLIVVTGDLADGLPQTLAQHVQPLAALRAPLGVYYVTGNHEYYWGADQWVAAAKNLGFTPLLNENRVLDFKGSKILIAGVTDPMGAGFAPQHRPDLEKAARCTEKTDAKILLAHRPDVFEEAQKAGFDLQLSGHTHAGQFFPFNVIVSFVYKHYRGLHQQENRWLYVNAGSAYWGPADRFAIPAEITLLRT